jgi:hypothetical protein
VRQPHIRGGAIFLVEISNPILINAEGRSMEEPSWKAERFIKLPQKTKKKSAMDEVQLQLDMFLELELTLVREIEINSV